MMESNTSTPYGSSRGYNYSVSGDKNDKIQNLSRDVDEATNAMRSNMTKVLERETKLNEMNERATDLEINAGQFQTSSNKVRRKFWWKNVKMWLILAAVGIIVLIIIAVAIYFSIDHSTTKSGGTAAGTPKPT